MSAYISNVHKGDIIMKRVYNFSAGPSALPLPVLEKAQAELLCYGDSGMSVMEMSHRSGAYKKIITEAEASLRSLMNIPDNYKILFLQGGASTQFSSVPLNLINYGKAKKGVYIVSGMFSNKAYKEAEKMGFNVECVASSKDKNFTYVPYVEADKIDPDASYVHICFNNTIYGSKYNYIPETNGVPLVADMSSCILSEPVDVTKFGVIYAGAQKNMAPAGLTVVIVREDLLGLSDANIPTMLDWKTMADNESMYNTPPTYSIYMAKLVYEWLESLGGLEEMAKRNKEKASLLYSYLDSQSFYKAVTDKACRSMMNVCFNTGDEELDKRFVAAAEAKGLTNLKGHRATGGMRASIYNAMTIDGVKALVELMKEFAAANQ